MGRDKSDTVGDVRKRILITQGSEREPPLPRKLGISPQGGENTDYHSVEGREQGEERRARTPSASQARHLPRGGEKSWSSGRKLLGQELGAI